MPVDDNHLSIHAPLFNPGADILHAYPEWVIKRVIESENSIGWRIVQDDYGEHRTDQNGRAYVYMPLPICRVPVGYGRTSEEARALADQICELLNANPAASPPG